MCIWMGVDGFVCFINFYSYIATVPAVGQWYVHLCSATLYILGDKSLEYSH